MQTENTQPPPPPLQTLGSQIRAQRKALHISATATAEAAGISRITLHRIEKGEPSVAMGAYCKTMIVLGLYFHATPRAPQSSTADIPIREGWIPVRIALADYPQLKQLAWQVHGTDSLTPTEALDIYERNARHLDTQSMTGAEQALLAALQQAFTHRTGDV